MRAVLTWFGLAVIVMASCGPSRVAQSSAVAGEIRVETPEPGVRCYVIESATGQGRIYSLSCLRSDGR